MKKVRLCSCGQRPAVYFKFHRTYMCEECAKDSGILIPCTGDAHKPGMGMIDHCAVCMPRWGWVEKIPMQIRAEVLKDQPGTAIPVMLGAVVWLTAEDPQRRGPRITVNYMGFDRDTGGIYVKDEGDVVCNFSFHTLTPEEAMILSEALLVASCFAQSATAKSAAGRLMLANPVYAAVYSQMVTELTAVRESIGDPL